MKQKLILFDIDQTLVDKLVRVTNPWKSACKVVYGVDIGTTFSQINTYGMTMKEISIVVLKKNGLKEEKIMEKIDSFFENLTRLYEKSLVNGKVSLFPKIPELLKKLSDKNYILGLVTGNTKEISFAKLKKAKIDKFFTIGGFGEDSIKREDLVEFALNRAKKKYSCEFDKKSVFVIGDTPRDISAAKKFPVQTIGVASGVYTKEDLSRAGADFVLDNLQDVKKVLSIID